MRFDFSYGSIRPLMTAIGTGPRWSSIEVGPADVRVGMGWAFRARIPRSTIQKARPHAPVMGSIGVHGWKGRWLVNGSRTGIVILHIDPPARAYVMGYPVRLQQLLLSVKDPAGFLAAIGH